MNTVFKTYKEIINVGIHAFPKNMYFYDIYPDFTACFIILIVPANLLGVPNLMRILYKISLLTKAQA
jgi:hypothetical protein